MISGSTSGRTILSERIILNTGCRLGKAHASAHGARDDEFTHQWMDGGALSPPWYPEGTPRRFTNVYPTKGACGPRKRKPKAESGELVIFTQQRLTHETLFY